MWLYLLVGLNQLIAIPITYVVARGRLDLDRRLPWHHDHKEWLPFERADSPLSLKEFMSLYLCATLLAPIRLIIVFGAFFAYWAVICILAAFGYTDSSQPMPTTLRQLYRWLGSTFSRTVLFGLGIHSIHRVGKPAKDLENSTLLCNHVSYLDILVLMAEVMPAFVAKEAISRAFGVGPMAKFAACLFVQQEAGTGQSEALRQRQVAMAAHTRPFPPLAVFAEGTTTNNRYMMPFKTGALRAAGRFHLVFFRWRGGSFSPAWEAVPFAVSFLGILTQWSTSVEVHYLSSHDVTEAEAADPQALAQRFCRIMGEAAGMEVIPTSYADKLKYFDWIMGQQGCLKQKST